MKRKKWLSAFAIGCALCAGAGIMSLAQTHAGAELIECDTTAIETLKSEYFLGESITVPETKIIHDGKEITPTETYMILPNGQANVATEYELTQTGIYTIVYVARVDGHTLKSEKTFKVDAKAYTFDFEESSTIEYKERLKMLDLTPEEKIWTDDLSGMELNLAAGDTFTYHKPIDLRENDGKLDFITLFPWQRNAYEEGWKSIQQVQQIYVRLTDCYNSETYVEYVLNWQGSMLYYRAGTNTQVSIGLSTKSLTNGTVVYMDGARRRVFINDWGMSVGAGLSQGRPYGHTLSYDVYANKAYVTDSTNKKHLINSFRSDLLYSEDEFFKGFTTGEVYLSIYGDGWNSERMQMDITQIGGVYGADLDITTVSDTDTPIVEIENGLDSYGNIKIAYGEAFDIPKAQAYDFNLSGDVTTAVYINYGKTGQARVATNGGTFTPTRLTTYTVEYTAKDSYGHKTVKTLDLQCVKTTSGAGIDFAVEKLTALQVGMETELPAYTAKGLNKTVQVNASYIRKDADGNAVESATIENGSFVPYYAGTYTLVYNYTDGVKSYEYSYDVACNASNAVAMLQAPVLPKYLTKGYLYTFEKFYVYSFASGEPKANLTTLQVSMDDGEFQTVDYDGVAITASESVKVRYQFNDWTSIVYEMKVVNIGTNGTLDMKEMFQGDVEKSATMESVNYKALGTGDVTVEFINIVSVVNFNFKYDIPVGYDNFESLVITLTDVYDENNKVNFTYYKNDDDNTVFNVDGKEDILGIPDFAGNVRNCFYNAPISTVVDTAGVRIQYPISFTSDKAFLSLTMKNVIGLSQVNVREVNNQSLSDLTYDFTEPQLKVGKTEGGIRGLNTNVTLYPMEITDIITPITSANLTVSVVSPSGKVVKDVNGTPIENLTILDGTYNFKLVEYGEYIATYTFSDQTGNSRTYQFVISVTDSEAPTLMITGSKTTSAKVGDVVDIADFKFADNITSEENMIAFVSLITPKYEILTMNGNSFRPTYAGVWTVLYYVCDEAGNCSTDSYEIVVK